MENLNEVNEAVAEVDSSTLDNDQLKEAVSGTLEKIRNQSMILGYRVACKTIMDMIVPWHQPNCSHREYERIFKKVEKFCNVALKSAGKQAEEVVEAETVQN